MTERPTCDVCGRPVHDTAYVCVRCAAVLRHDLADAAQVAGEAVVTIARLSRGEPGTCRSSTVPLPFDWDAADAAWAVANTLSTWTRHICAESGRALPVVPVDAYPSAVLAGWLAECEQVDWLRYRQEAAEAFDELTDAARLAVRVVDRHPERWYAGKCTPGFCDEDLYALPGALVVRCWKCRAEHDAQARKQWLLRLAADRLMHAAWLAAALTRLGERLPPGTVRSWASRGLLAAHGVDEHGRPVYRVGDALALLARQTKGAAA
jgi:hypothetical protein